MSTSVIVGQTVGSKPISLRQLQDELVAAGIDVGNGIGMSEQHVFVYDANGVPSDFPTAEQSIVDQAIADHVAMRDKTDTEFATEFQDPNTTVARKQDIRDMQSGLMPREQVPMT